MIAYAQEYDVDRLVKLERQTWIPPLQASRETIAQRLHNGHRILMHTVQSIPVSVVCWCYGHLPNHDPAAFPRSFDEFSTGHEERAGQNAAHIYNVGTHAAYRGKGLGAETLRMALQNIRYDEIQDIFLDGRCPSYNGSQNYTQEKVQPVPDVKNAIDKAWQRGTVPTLEEAQHDPTLRFYIKQGFRPYAVRANFYPADDSSGAFRVILHQKASNISTPNR